MIYKLADLLKDEIESLDIVEVAAGLAAPKVVRNNATDLEADVPTMADITVPMAYNDLGLVCEEGDLYALMPNTKKKSIHWFEDNGIELVSEDTYYYHSRASLTLVSWWNMPLINASLKSPDLLVANLIATIPASLTTTDYMSQIRVTFEGQEPNLDEILGRYTFNFPEDQINTYPYALTALRFSVDFAFGKNCVDAVPVVPTPCPPTMIGELFSLFTYAYSGSQVAITFGISKNIIVDWGDETAERVTATAVKTSAYTSNDSYTIKVGGAPNVTSISVINSANGGNVAWLAEFINLQTLQLVRGTYSGSISGLSVLTSLTSLTIWDLDGNMTVTGSIAGFTTLTNLTNLVLREIAVTGDVAAFLAVLSSATVINLRGTSVDYTSATLPAWDGITFSMEDVGLSDAEIDSILSDMATATMANSTIDLDGTNGAPTDDVDYDTLVGLGNTVSVNVKGLNAGGGTDTDWLIRQGVYNLPTLWDGDANITYTRVTGNGFTGYAIRSELTAPALGNLSISVDADGSNIFTIGSTYTVSVKYRKKIGSLDLNIVDGGTNPLITSVDNEGNAATATTPVFTAVGTGLLIAFWGGVGAAGDWFEIDEIVVEESLFGAEYAAVYNSYTTKPNSTKAAIWNTFVQTIVASGEWAMLDFMRVYASHTNGASEALVNWINPGTYDAILVGAPVFTIDEGFLGSVGNYINCNWNPSTDATNYILDSATIGAYSRTDIDENSTIIGGNDAVNASRMQPRRTGTARITINEGNVTDDRDNVADSLGMLIATRTASNVQKLYKNKVAVVNGTDVSTAIPNVDLFSLANNNNGVSNQHRNGQISLDFGGAGFTQTNVDNITDAFEVAMDALGKGVIP